MPLEESLCAFPVPPIWFTNSENKTVSYSIGLNCQKSFARGEVESAVEPNGPSAASGATQYLTRKGYVVPPKVVFRQWRPGASRA